jgi:hypothetical protein
MRKEVREHLRRQFQRNLRWLFRGDLVARAWLQEALAAAHSQTELRTVG